MSAYRAGDLVIALANFDLAIDMDPGLPDSYINRGIVFRRMGDLKRALSDVAEAKRIEEFELRFASTRALTPPAAVRQSAKRASPSHPPRIWWARFAHPPYRILDAVDQLVGIT